MEQKEKLKTRLALIVCVFLFLTALGLYILHGARTAKKNAAPINTGVVISEVMSNNRTYPDSKGNIFDYIEIANLSDTAVDVSGYKLSDDELTIGYTFPANTVIPPMGAVVCWCDSKAGDGYGSFGIDKDGGETVYLYNSANILIDRQKIPALAKNVPYIRGTGDTWSFGRVGTPGFANTDEGYAQWLQSMGYVPSGVVISEVQTANEHTWLDGDRTVCDWIELYNPGSEPVILDGMFLSDDPEDLVKWSIPKLSVEPGAYAVIRCGGQRAEDARFSLSRDGCELTLSGALGNPICRLTCPRMRKDASLALQQDGTYQVTATPTPGFENTEEGYSQWLDSVGAPEVSVVISEVQTANGSAVLDSGGQLCDWIELYNPGSEPVVLDGMFLSDDPEDRFQWEIPTLTLEPGGYEVVRCVGVAAAEGEASFALPKSGCTVTLYGPVGNIISQTQCPALEEDSSWQRMEDGSYIQTNQISPGFENTEAGYLEFRDTQSVLGALAITEVMPSNDRYMVQRDGEYYDWIELKNVSEQPVDLSDYAVSDSGGDLMLFSLPERTLAPGELVVLICSGNTELPGSYIQVPFTLNRDTCWVYVTHKQDGLSDYYRVSGVPVQGSAGRMDGDNRICYFSCPTPGTENQDGMAEIANVPFAETPDGVYNGVDRVDVILSGEEEIRYTLDGSVPTIHSPLYEKPLHLTETTVVRVRGFSNGKLPSGVATFSYIINENHTLPVISVAAAPGDLFGEYGIYTKYTSEWEVPCNLTLYEGDGGFSIDCGIKMYGHTGLMMPKKSFKVNFRSNYGESVLTYPVYGEDGPYIYDSLCIRSGQDYPQSIFRDELFTSLCRDMSDHVLAQRDKFCILYINGEYFGIYCMKEAFSEMFYAQNRGVSEESVEVVQAPVAYTSEVHKFMRFLYSSDMTDPKNYEYACSVFNMDSLIDWIIIEGYSTNGDVQQNLRYFRSSENGNRYEMAFYDLDWAFYFHYPFMDVLSNTREDWQHLMLTRNLMENPTFRQKFLERLSYHMQHTLSNDNVVKRIDYYHDLLAPEVERERDRWGSSYSSWESQVDYLRTFVTDYDNMREIVDRLIRYINLTQEEIDTYFWRWYQ